MDAEDRDLFERSIAGAVASASGVELDQALHDLGWLDALAEDAPAAVSILFEQLGRGHASSSALDHLLARALSGGSATGATGGVVLPALGGIDPPGRLDGDRLVVSGLATDRILRQDTALVPATTPSGTVGIEVATTGLTLRPVAGLDPDLGLVQVTGTVDRVDAGTASSVAWEPALAIAQLAVGHELVGVARTMLELARTHALERIQFGQPIAAFQAVRHRLAEALVAIESADALLAGAWEDRAPVTAAMAKAQAGRAARTTARHGQQVLAGIGFTTEHDLHLHVRRTLVLDELFGSARVLTAALGRTVVGSRELPPLLPL